MYLRLVRLPGDRRLLVPWGWDTFAFDGEVWYVMAGPGGWLMRGQR
jgi:hypothetical protein